MIHNNHDESEANVYTTLHLQWLYDRLWIIRRLRQSKCEKIRRCSRIKKIWLKVAGISNALLMNIGACSLDTLDALWKCAWHACCRVFMSELPFIVSIVVIYMHINGETFTLRHHHECTMNLSGWLHNLSPPRPSAKESVYYKNRVV